jgi:hypothetical protein
MTPPGVAIAPVTISQPRHLSTKFSSLDQDKFLLKIWWLCTYQLLGYSPTHEIQLKV